MSVEGDLKRLILARYGSLREFVTVLEMPYSTLDSMLKRGLANTNISNIVKICNELNLSADALAKGEIEYLDRNQNRDDWYKNILRAYDSAPRAIQRGVCDLLRIPFAPSPGAPGDPDEWVKG